MDTVLLLFFRDGEIPIKQHWEAGEEWWRSLLHRYAVDPRRSALALQGWRAFMTEQALDLFAEGKVREAKAALARLKKIDRRERRSAQTFFADRIGLWGLQFGPGHSARVVGRVRVRAERAYAVYRREYPGSPESFEAWLESWRESFNRRGRRRGAP